MTVLVVVFHTTPSQAAMPLEMANEVDFYSLTGKHFDIYLDSTNQLEASQILSKLDQPNIEWPADESLYSNPFIGNNLWLRFNATGDTELTGRDWWLEFPDFHISEIDVYELNGSELILLGKQGYTRPFKDRDLDYKNPMVRIRPKGQNTYLIRMNSEIGASYKVFIGALDAKFNYTTRQYLDAGFYYGILFLLALYNFMLFFFIRQKRYLFFVGYVMVYIFQSFDADGIGFQFIWPSLPWINQMYDLTLVFLILLLVLYSDSFLDLSSRLPKLRKWLWASFGLFGLSFVFNAISNGSLQVNTFALVIPYSVILYLCITLYRKGYKDVRFFIIGYSFLLASVFISFLMRARLIEDNAFTIYVMDYGFLAEALFMSLAMGDSLRQSNESKLKAQREVIQQQNINEELQLKVQKELEDKVKERTTELAEKNEKLEELTEELNTVNSQLDKDVWQLGRELKDVFRGGILNQHLTFEQFSQSFPDEMSCHRFLRDLKWENGFECRKCGNDKWHDGGIAFSRKCSKCNSRETTTSNTLFHRLRLPLNKALYIVYIVMNFDKAISLEDLQTQTGISKSSISTFRKKVRDKIASTGDTAALEEVVL